ncbi:mitochondrial proton/calcium exchanger protein-like protein isoform X1 [Tanacetum coccineum]|uniref:Mitochondrial proton/calcium exchanger protein-like protein isoform X1 n=1 Tax=Tanacetum coccineum TaxID=301880 RepID=A0ABQ5IDW1_9ASTR
MTHQCITRSSTSELFTPYEEPEREFRSSRKHFKTLSLDELRSPGFDLFYDQEDYLEEEVAGTMAETMEQYMSKTRADYGSGIARPKIEDKDHFELKGQFLKELRDKTFSGSNHEDANEHIEKVLEIINLFHVPNITQDQLMLRVFPISLTGAFQHDKFLFQGVNYQSKNADDECGHQVMAVYSQKWHNGTPRTRRCEHCKGPHYTKDCPLKEEGTTLEEAYYTQFGEPFQRGGYRAAAPGFYQRNNVNPSYQKRRKSMEDTLSKFMGESAKRQEENSNLIKEIRASTDATIRNQGASIKTLEIQIRKISKVLQERGFGSLPTSTEANPRDQVKSISTTIEADSYPIRRIGSSQYSVSTGQNRTPMYETRQMTILFLSRLNGYYFDKKKGSYGPQFSEAYSEASHIDNSIPQKEKDPGSFTLPCFINNVCFDNALVDLGASVSVMPLSTYLNLGLGELALTKLTVELADKTVKYPKGIAENVLVGVGKFVFPIDVFKQKITLMVGEERIIFKSVKLASSLIKRVYMLSLRERMELDLEARLMGETLVINRSLDPLNEDYIELNDLNEPFELRRNQGDDLMPTIEEGEVIEEFRTRDDELDTGIDDYPSYCDYDKKIHIDSKGRYSVSVPALTKDHEGNMINTPYPEKTNTSYWRYRRSSDEVPPKSKNDIPPRDK